MGKRNTGRKLAMQILYQATLRKEDDISEIIDGYLGASNYEKETVTWATELATDTWTKKSEIDPIIMKRAIGWDFDRINPIDKSILRIALYEIIELKTDKRIVINEAVEMAKKYSTDESPKFINGILGKFVQEV